MALFHNALTHNNFKPLFQFLDDYDDHHTSSGGRTATPFRNFQPRFDVHEEGDAYYLNGELPGIEKENVQIEFSDQQTLTIHGRVERNYTSSHDSAQESKCSKSQEHNVEVEPKKEENTKKQVSITASGEKRKAKKPSMKYWATERSIGEFHRSFSFPTNVDPEKVKASLSNGILSVTVPKAMESQARRIQIE